MRLLTQEDLARLQAQDPHHPSGPGRELPSTELMVIVKFFTPDSNWTWYAVSASQNEDSGEVHLFGLVDGFEKELGYFCLSELESVRGPLGLPIERDLHWKPVPLSDLL
jgi:hypothetical protein